MLGSNLTMMSTAEGIDFLIAHEKRLTDMEAMSENCGVYIRLELLVHIGIPPVI
jgi:hypothetical protein